MTNMILIIIFFKLFWAEVSSQVLYELKDLEVLLRDKNYDEFLMHINDIRPSERERHYLEMVQTMALGFVDLKIKNKDYSPLAFKKIEELGQTSYLQADEFYQSKRSFYAVKFFNSCFLKAAKNIEAAKNEAEKIICENELKSFWNIFRKDPDLGLELGLLLDQNKSSLNRWTFYAPAAKDRIAHLYCKKTPVKLALIHQLYLATNDFKFNGNYQELINKMMLDSCFNQITDDLKEIMTSINSNGLEKEMALNILLAKNKLTSEELDFYAVLYLLDGPVVGDKMNLAWKAIENLSQNFSKRNKILLKIKELALIPDKIFKDPNLPRHKAIINLFSTNFPELLNFYGESCLKLITYSPQNQLSNISSSFQCHQFLSAAVKQSQSAVEKKWISDSIKRQYSGVKK